MWPYNCTSCKGGLNISIKYIQLHSRNRLEIFHTAAYFLTKNDNLWWKEEQMGTTDGGISRVLHIWEDLEGCVHITKEWLQTQMRAAWTRLEPLISRNYYFWIFESFIQTLWTIWICCQGSRKYNYGSEY